MGLSTRNLWIDANGRQAHCIWRRIAIVPLLAIAAAAVACQGTSAIEIGGEFMGARGAFKGYHSSNGRERTATVTETPGDARVDIEFRDANGNVVGDGAVGVGPGESVMVPPGATTMTVSGPSASSACTGCNGGAPIAGGPSVIHETSDRQMTGVAEYFSYGMPVDPIADPDSPDYGALANVSWSIILRDRPGLTRSQVFARIAPIVMASAPLIPPAVPSNIEIESLARMVPNEPGLGGTIFYADRSAQPHTYFEMYWNDSFYADLVTNSTVHSIGHWQVIEVDIPQRDFSLFGNEAAITSQTIEDPNPIAVLGYFETL